MTLEEEISNELSIIDIKPAIIAHKRYLWTDF